MKVLLNCIPKCGSFLLLKAFQRIAPLKKAMKSTAHPLYIQQIPHRDKIETIRNIPHGHFFSGHQIDKPEVHKALEDFVIFQMVRDPRDMIISRYYHECGSVEYHRCRRLNDLSKQEAIREILLHVEGVKRRFGIDATHEKLNIGEYVNSFRGFWNNPRVHVIKFEDLVGSKGGGSDARQLRVLNLIKNVTNSDVDTQQVAATLFGETPTFRKGKLGQWKIEMSPPNKALANKLASDVIQELGYA